MMWGWDSGSTVPWFGMFFGPVIMIGLFFVGVLFFAYVMRAVVAPGWYGRPDSYWQEAPEGKSALDLLKERFARGEIDRNEYEERRRVLSER